MDGLVGLIPNINIFSSLKFLTLVLKDLVEQKCNRKQAREIYGVIIYKNKLDIDWTNTLKIRRRMKI